MKVQVVLAMYCGLPAYDPYVTTDKDQAQAQVDEWCEHYGLDKDDPHDDETDIFWWEAEVANVS